MKRVAVGLLTVSALGAGAWYLTRAKPVAVTAPGVTPVSSGSAASVPSPLDFLKGIVQMTTPGIRNNNPLNMRDYNIPWQGKVGADSAGLLIFDKVENGIRAAGNDLKNKWLRGYATIRAIVSEWAPPKGKSQSGTEYTNPTDKYIQFVSKETGITPDAPLSSFEQYFAISKAMIKMENGKNPYSDSLVASSLLTGMRHGAPLPIYFDWGVYVTG